MRRHQHRSGRYPSPHPRARSPEGRRHRDRDLDPRIPYLRLLAIGLRAVVAHRHHLGRPGLLLRLRVAARARHQVSAGNDGTLAPPPRDSVRDRDALSDHPRRLAKRCAGVAAGPGPRSRARERDLLLRAGPGVHHDRDHAARALPAGSLDRLGTAGALPVHESALRPGHLALRPLLGRHFAQPFPLGTLLPHRLGRRAAGPGDVRPRPAGHRPHRPP